MLRIHFLPHGFELSAPGAEEALDDSRAMHQFVGIDQGKARDPAMPQTRKENQYPKHFMEQAMVLWDEGPYWWG